MIKRLLNRFKRRKKHPYEKLDLGRIQKYILKIPKLELDFWINEGWVEAPNFYDIHYRPESHEIYIMSKSKTFSETTLEKLIDNFIVGWSPYYGSYGMGGPGFLGFTLDDSKDYQSSSGRDVLVFAVWGAGQYTLIDNRIVTCTPQFYSEYRPWFSEWADADIEQWDDLTSMLIGCKISEIDLGETKCTLTVTKESLKHTIEFFKNDPRLPPMGNGEARYDAFKTGVIGDYIVFQKENAVLYL
jgi:hypothetical protein